jgi:transcriptional regulator with XRE-family HTH domain
VLKALITTNQIRAARALIRWTALDLAESSGIAISTIKRYELMDGVPAGNVKTLIAIQQALEGAGIEFIGSPDDGPGVRLRSGKR